MKIDFHVHTNISPCSDMSLKDAVRTAINNGLSGIAICNHNTVFLKSDIPYELEEEFNIKINPNDICENAFYIIPGIEISSNGNHFLGLFIENKVESISELKQSGALVVFAHPFEHSFDYQKRLNAIIIYITDIDLIETHSGRANYKNKTAVSQATTFSDSFGINKCAGSDAHFTHEIGNAWAEFDNSVFGLDEIKNALLNGDATFYQKNCKRIDIAKSQIVKHGYNFKTIAYYLYSFIRDLGDKLCQR